MLKREYIVFAAFVLMNAMLAMNCFTMSLYTKINDIEKKNQKFEYDNEEFIVRKNWHENFETLNTPNPKKSSEINLIWTPNDSYTMERLIRLASKSFRNALCIVIQENQNEYIDPNISACSIWNDPINSLHAIPKELSEKIIEPRLTQIEELIYNSEYADNLIFLLKNKSYLSIHVNKLYSEPSSWELFTEDDPNVQKFLDNRKGKIIRKKINTIIRVNYKNYNKSYVSFIQQENTKSRIIKLEWQSVYDSNKDPKFIPITLLYPLTVAMDIVLFPVGVILSWTGIITPFKLDTK
jgi:hypothetical protein